MTFWNKPMADAVSKKRQHLDLMKRKALVEAMDAEGLPTLEDDTEETLRQVLLAEYVAGPGNMTTRRKIQRYVDEISVRILSQVMTEDEAIRWLTIELAKYRAWVWLEAFKMREARIMRDAEPSRD